MGRLADYDIARGASTSPAAVHAPTLASAGAFLVHDLENAVPYLLARAGMRMGQSFSAELKQYGISLTEWRVCVALRHQPHQRLSELASNTSTEPSALSRSIESLLQRGLLARDRVGDDALARSLVLSDEGLALTERIIPAAQLYERIALAGLTPAQADQLRDLLRRVYDNMDALDRRN